MLKVGAAKPANAEWASHIVFVLKKNEKLRFCVDYRRLNAVAVRDGYAIPRMDECIHSFGEARIFPT